MHIDVNQFIVNLRNKAKPDLSKNLNKACLLYNVLCLAISILENSVPAYDMELNTEKSKVVMNSCQEVKVKN